MPTEFRLRFPLSEVMYWAARYAYADDVEVEAIGNAARERGWFTPEGFRTVMRWKTRGRNEYLCVQNTAAEVEEATRLALSTPDERKRMEALIRLRGVAYPTASVLLHLAHRDPYPILDYRALWSLGVETPPAAYSFAFWWAYTQTCRALAKQAVVRMRTFDRALWQYSKERQGPSSNKVGTPPAETGSAPSEPGHKDHGAASTSSVPGSRTPTEGTNMPGTRRYPYRADIHARLIATAINGVTIPYSGLGTSRRMVGSYLYRIAKEEEAAGRPPLTALVVHKADGKPGPGFLEAAKWVGFWREGETETEVWSRAVKMVHEYWRPKLTDDLG